MDGQSDQQLIAQGRAPEITLSPAHLYYRDQLATAAADTDAHRVHQAINNVQFFTNQSPKRDKPSIKEKIPGTMLTNLAIHGDGFKEMKYRCEAPYLAFMCALKGDRPDTYEPPDKDKDKVIFDDFDGANFIWTRQEDVSKSV